jgi:hypothetical protein
MATLTHSNQVFDYRPERVTINSLRSTMAGYEHGDTTCWDENWKSLIEESGVQCACVITGSMQYFVRCLRSSSQIKREYFPVSCRRLSADECVTLSLLAGHQHNDARTIDYCMDQLLQQDRDIFSKDLDEAANLLSLQLMQFKLVLMPIPLEVITTIMESACCICTKQCKIIH